MFLSYDTSISRIGSIVITIYSVRLKFEGFTHDGKGIISALSASGRRQDEYAFDFVTSIASDVKV